MISTTTDISGYRQFTYVVADIPDRAANVVGSETMYWWISLQDLASIEVASERAILSSAIVAPMYYM